MVCLHRTVLSMCQTWAQHSREFLHLTITTVGQGSPHLIRAPKLVMAELGFIPGFPVSKARAPAPLLGSPWALHSAPQPRRRRAAWLRPLSRSEGRHEGWQLRRLGRGLRKRQRGSRPGWSHHTGRGGNLHASCEMKQDQAPPRVPTTSPSWQPWGQPHHPQWERKGPRPL